MIAVDAMGGDNAPDVVVEGALSCVKKSGLHVCLFGDEKVLSSKLDALDSSWKNYNITIKNTHEIIDMHEEPVSSVRKKQGSSLVQAVNSVKNGTCRAVMSAGNSGAVMAAATLLFGRVSGVDRPALACLLPGLSRPTICLDLGANVDCKAKNLYQFAHLGVRYAHDLLGVKNPSVGLLANGEEDSKGSELTKEAFLLLKDSDLNFVGNIEPGHVMTNKVDVLLSDGFVGNIFLKTFEATVGLCISIVKKDFWKDHAQMIETRVWTRVSEKECSAPRGGAILLGVKKPTVIVHGNASAKAIERAIMFTDTIVKKIDVSTYSL